MPKHILFVANYFPPISGPGSIRPYYFVKYLAQKGFKITVLAAQNDPIYGLDESLNTHDLGVKIIRFDGNDFSNFKKWLFKLRLYFLFFFLFPIQLLITMLEQIGKGDFPSETIRDFWKKNFNAELNYSKFIDQIG